MNAILHEAQAARVALEKLILEAVREFEAHHEGAQVFYVHLVDERQVGKRNGRTVAINIEVKL